MDTEVIATSAVKTSVSVTDYLSPYINEHDKEPIWDGNIYVYTNKNKLNDSCMGRVPVQIKSQVCNDMSKETITYPIRTNDLRKYLSDNGVMYFVVYIAEDGSTKIYYSDLLPFKIKKLLDEAGEQGTKKAKLTIFPENNVEKVDLFFNFLQDREMQKSVGNTKLITIEELEKMGQLKELSLGFATSQANKEFPIDYLFKQSFYMYATVLPLGIKVPVDITKIESAEKTLNRPVSCNGKQYYTSYNEVHKKDMRELHIGKSTVFEIKKGTNNVAVKFNTQGTLKQRITDQAFFIDMMENGSVNVGDIVFHTIQYTPEEISGFKLEERKKQLDYLKNIQVALDGAGVKKELDCNALSNVDEANLRLLIDAFVYQKAVSFGKSVVVEPIGKMTIANICIMLIAKKQEEGLYVLSNYFKDKIFLRVRYEEIGDFDTSQYTIMNKDSFLHVSNIDYDAIYNDIVIIEGNKHYWGQITQLLLEMLLAYDEGNSNNTELLHLTQRISEWLMKFCDDRNDTYIALLNYLQTIKRSRALNGDELKELFSLIENGNTTEAILTGAYILLENSSGAKLHYNNLPPEEQASFDNYPICNLWNKDTYQDIGCKT